MDVATMMQRMEGVGAPVEREHDFDRLFREDGPGLWRTMVAFTGGRRDIAEEAVAEAFARALQHAPGIRDPIPWMYRTAFRIARDELKRDARRGPAVDSGSEDPAGTGELLRALRQLSPNQRAAIVLRIRGRSAGRRGRAPYGHRRPNGPRAPAPGPYPPARAARRGGGLMPERWQDELKKLRREEMPDGVRERAEAGPRRELPKDGRQRVVAGLVAFAVFIAAGAFAWRAFDRAGTVGSERTLSPSLAAAPGTLVLDLSSHDNAPSFSISFEGAVQEGIRQGYNWCGSGSGCVNGIGDFAYYSPVTEYLPVADGTTLQVTGDAESFEVEVSDTDGMPIKDIAVADGSLVAPAAGRYVWNVKSTWSQGDGNAFFGLEVLPPVDQIPDVLHLTCTPDRATADGTVVRAQADGVHIAIDASPDVTGADLVRGASPDEFLGIGADAPQDGSRRIRSNRAAGASAVIRALAEASVRPTSTPTVWPVSRLVDPEVSIRRAEPELHGSVLAPSPDGSEGCR